MCIDHSLCFAQPDETKAGLFLAFISYDHDIQVSQVKVCIDHSLCFAQPYDTMVGLCLANQCHLIPSIRDPWLYWSENIASSGPRMVWKSPKLAVNPEVKSRQASLSRNLASCSSSSAWRLEVPPSRRELEVPLPNCSRADLAEDKTSGWELKPAS